ncbi:MAG: substrate-binding domain-containing protein, partial [Agathobacter sp.]
ESASLEQVSYIAEGNDEVIAYVQNYPGAIGYVSKGKAVAAKGVSLVETDEKIARPFYLVHMGEQNDLERDFVTFLLSAGQEIIQTEYEPVKKTTSFLSNRSEGALKIGGSSSVAGVMQLLADEYMKRNPNATVAVVTTDSADGVNGAINATYDFGMVSRELESYEKELLNATKIAEDEIVLIVNENNPIQRMTMEEIGKIYDGTYTAWSNLKEEK